MEWNDETIVRLRSLWDEGHSTAEIGRRIGISKNAVVGKAHRLGLPARPSPIRRDAGGGVPRIAPPRRVIGPTLPPLAAALAPEPPLAPRPLPVRPVVVAPLPVLPAPIAAPVGVAAPRGAGRPQPCCWPLGEPGTKSFRFCDAESVPGKPYCLEHAQLAYVRVRDRREEAA